MILNKISLTIVLTALLLSNIYAQDTQLDSLKAELTNSTQDTNKVLLLIELCKHNARSSPDDKELKVTVPRKLPFLAAKRCGSVRCRTRSNSSTGSDLA